MLYFSEQLPKINKIILQYIIAMFKLLFKHDITLIIEQNILQDETGFLDPVSGIIFLFVWKHWCQLRYIQLSRVLKAKCQLNLFSLLVHFKKPVFVLHQYQPVLTLLQIKFWIPFNIQITCIRWLLLSLQSAQLLTLEKDLIGMKRIRLFSTLTFLNIPSIAIGPRLTSTMLLKLVRQYLIASILPYFAIWTTKTVS